MAAGTNSDAGHLPTEKRAVDKGRLVIEERAIERIAVAAALQVAGVTQHRGGITRLSGRDLPRAEVSVGKNAGGQNSVAVNLFINIEWPCRISDVTTAVHDDVAATLVRLTDLPLHKLDVLVAGLTRGAADPTVRAENAVPPKAPAASPAALPFALVLAAGLGGLAYAAARELLIDNGTVSGAPWLRNTAEWVSRQYWQPWMLVAALGVVLAGLVLLAVAVKPRAKTHIRLTGAGPDSTVWMRPGDISRVVRFQALRVRGVESARAVVSRRKIRVSVTAFRPFDLTDTAVSDSLTSTTTLLHGTRNLTIEIQ